MGNNKKKLENYYTNKDWYLFNPNDFNNKVTVEIKNNSNYGHKHSNQAKMFLDLLEKYKS